MFHNCNYCQSACIKKGVRKNIQKYLCKTCGKWQQKKYRYKKAEPGLKDEVVRLTKEGNSISSVARLTHKAKSGIQKIIYKLGSVIEKPEYNECDQDYELDEMSVVVAGKEDQYLIYAINRKTRNVIDFVVGNRTKQNIKKVVDVVLDCNPRRIFTDGLNSYPSLIPEKIHKPGRQITNRIERKNLSLRNSIKRLARATLCFSKNIEMLDANLRLICWS